MNPYMMTPNSFPRGYGPFTMYPNYRMFNPYWNMNPYFFRRTPEIPHPHEDRDSNSPASQLNRYLTYLYELYTGELFHHRHPKVSVDVHTSKSDIPGSKPRDIVVRTRRQLLNYLPVSPLTTGQYHFPGMAFSRRVLPLKRSSMAKSKRSTKERVASRKIKIHEEKEINTKRDEFTRQRTENNEQNMIQMNPSSPGPTQFRNGEQNDQLPTLNAGAEGFNEIGPGGLNGVATEPQVDRPQAQGFYDGTAGQEQKMLNANEQQDFIQQQPQEQQQPMSDFQVNPNFAQLQGLQGESRMAVPDNENEMLQLRGQPPFLPPGGPLLPPSGQISAPFFPTEPEGLPQPMMPMMRPFAPYPFVPLPPFPLQPPFPLEPPFQPPLPPAQSFVPEPEPSAQPSVNVNINTIKSSLPRRKSKKDSSTTEKVVSRTVPDREHKRTNKRQSISLLRRIPALQVLPQTFLQDGVQIPSFSRTQTGKETRHHGVNGMVISELQRKHDIPSKSKSKQTAHKRQFYHLPFNVHQVQPVQPVQLVQPFLSPVTPFGFHQRPRVHVQVDIGKRKSDFSSNKDSNDTERKPNKVKRQIYGMNELPHGLKFSEEVTNLSNDKNLVKKFKIRSDGDMDTSDSSRAKTQKRHVDSSTQKPKNETSSKKISLMSKAATTDDADKRQFVLPFGGKNGQEYYGAHEEMQHVQQVPQQVEQVQPDSQQVEQQPFAQQVEQNEPQAMQNAAMTEQQAIDPQQMVQDQTQAYTNPLQQVGQGPFLARQPQVNVNVQVAKSDIGKNNGKKSLLAQLKNHKTKIVSRRQLFGTVPLLSPVVHADVNAVAREGNGRSSVPDTTATKHTRAKRQLGVAQPFAAPNQQYQSLGAEAQPFQPLSALPQPYVTTSPYQPGPRVNINVQTSRSSVHRHKRQLYDILSGQRAQAKKTNQPKVDLSRRSVSKQIHVKGARSIKKEKRQLQDLINNILERRRGPKLLQNMLKRPKPPIMFTTNNDNNPKPIDVFPGNRGGNNLGEGQPSPNDGGIGNPFAGLAPRPSPALQANQNPLGANLASPFRDTPVMQDDQPALTSQMQQRARTPLIAPEEPNGRQNIIQFLQNSGLPNAQLIPQQMNDEPPRMFQGPQFPGILPLPLPLPFLRPPEMGAPPVLGDQRSFAPFPPAPVVPPFGAQFPWRMYPMAPRPPPQFPYYPFAFPQMQPEFGNSPGPNEDNGDEDRPSVNVNVETSKSKIPKSKKS
ncbi:hypothetical protein QZH41_014181 [Actinostola sp. cb2023]|nr:hypothetical protein QZH41_014181 [Actinostola sp. cb2023]